MADRESGELIVDTAFGLSEGIIRGERARLGQGIASYVIEHGEPVVIGDPRSDPRLEGIEFSPRPEIHSAICVPIKLAGSVDAVLSISRRLDPSPFTEDDLRLACDLADQLIPCVENTRLYQETAQRLKGLSGLPDVADAVSSSLNVLEILRPLAERIVALSGAAGGRVYRYLRHPEPSRAPLLRGPSPSRPSATRCPPTAAPWATPSGTSSQCGAPGAHARPRRRPSAAMPNPTASW